MNGSRKHLLVALALALLMFFVLWVFMTSRSNFERQRVQTELEFSQMRTELWQTAIAETPTP